MSAAQLPDLPSVEGLPSDHTEHHPDGTTARWVVRYPDGKIQDEHYLPDGTLARWVVRYPDGSIEDRHYLPDGTRAAVIRHTP